VQLQKPTAKIKQLAIQLGNSQLFQKLKNRSTNKQGLSLKDGGRVIQGSRYIYIFAPDLTVTSLSLKHTFYAPIIVVNLWIESKFSNSFEFKSNSSPELFLTFNSKLVAL
jgi:hypothetical protein